MCLKVLYKNVFPYLLYYNKFNINRLNYCRRNLIMSAVLRCNKHDNESKELARYNSFENVTNKTKDSYLDMVKIFENRDVHRRGHVEFIYSALRHMESFGVHKDLEVYKSLIDVLPKGKFIPTNIFQAEFMHYPKQQQCAIDLLQQMEDNGVMPDLEIEDILKNIFGRRGYPLRKYWRMMYWMPKFKNLSPWPLPAVLPNDSLELAKLAIARIASVDLHSEITVYQSADIQDSIDNTWIVSAQSPTQKELIKNHKLDKPVYVEGSFRIWLKNNSVNYFILRSDPNENKPQKEQDEDDVSNIKFSIFNMSKPKSEIIKVPSVHEQEDGTILAVCATGTSSRDSLLSWVRHLEKNDNPNLGKAIVVFTLKSPSDKEPSESLSLEDDIKRIDDKKIT